MKRRNAIAIAATAVSVSLWSSPMVWADPDPHLPNGSANWCPGGQHPGYGGIRYCAGEPFPDGTFYADMWHLGPGGPFGRGAWSGSVMCSQWIEHSIQGAFAGGCGGGPSSINY